MQGADQTETLQRKKGGSNVVDNMYIGFLINYMFIQKSANLIESIICSFYQHDSFIKLYRTKFDTVDTGLLLIDMSKTQVSIINNERDRDRDRDRKIQIKRERDNS